MMIKSHKHSVDHDAKGDIEVDERVKNDERQILKKQRREMVVILDARWQCH